MPEQSRNLVTIAAAPTGNSTPAFRSNGEDSPQETMSYACQTCTKRKVKCDKVAPVCSSCRKGMLDCFYQAPPPRQRKRKLSTDLSDKVLQYERILSEHGLLPENGNASSGAAEVKEDAGPGLTSLLKPDPNDASKPGRLLAWEGKSRYVDSNIWKNIGEDDIHRMSDESDDDEDHFGMSLDPLSSVFMGSPSQNLAHLHPSHPEAMALWNTYVENVEPICKVTHVPSITEMISSLSQQPETASKADECMAFSIYHFAVFSMTTEECEEQFEQTRAILLQRFNFATRQALVNASFLKTSELSILRALILYLHACRNMYDPKTYWMLTGVASRLAQGMGLHRDAEMHGLPPFEVQMRRRLFYQVIPLEGMASQMAGIGMPFVPDSWIAQAPLNLNDADIWPGMTETPKERRGATEMIFCLARACVGKFMSGAGRMKDYHEAEPVIHHAEREVEETYIRYCDVTNPLHFLTISFARSAINAMRLRTRLPKGKGQVVSADEAHQILEIAQKILDTDTAAYSNLSMRKYMWHVNAFFAWGSWDSIIFILTSLRRPNVFTPSQVDSAWKRIDAIYSNHDVLLDAKRAVQIAMGRLTLRAWMSNPPSKSVPEPAFISTLRSLRKVNPDIARAEGVSNNTSNTATTNTSSATRPVLGPSPSSDANALFGSLSSEIELGSDFNLDTADWMFWDQLIKDYQVQGAAVS